MQTQAGVIKQILGLVVAIDQNGVSRVLKVGDALYLGEVIKTSSASSKAVVSMDNGKDVTILGDETFKLDEVATTQNANNVADVSDLQKALLDGKGLSNLEETAAGGNAAAGGGDGVSLGAATFDQGGHYSNISENFRSIGDINTATGAGGIGGISGGAADNVSGDTPVNPDLTRIPNKPSKIEFPEDSNHDGKISDDENKGVDGDNDHGKTTVDVTVPTDGSVKPGDKVVIKDEDGNKVGEKEITKEDLDNGGKVSISDVPVKPGNNPVVAEIVNPNNPNNPSQPATGNITEDHEVSIDLTPKHDGTVEVVSRDNDATKVEISYTDNGGNTQTITVVKNPSTGWVVDSTPGKTTAPTGAFKLDPNSGKVTISDDATKDNTPVTAKATDAAGNKGTTGKDEIVFDFTTTKIDADAIWQTNEIGISHPDNINANIVQNEINLDSSRNFEITAKRIVKGAHITTGDGDDVITVVDGWGGRINNHSSVNLGDGTNILSVAKDIDLSTVQAGSGNDVVTVGHWIREHSDINLGNGNNTLTVGDRIINSTVTTGDGNDTVKVENAIIGTTVKLGAGDDTVIVGNKDITDNTLTGKSNIDGGDGYDKLTITNPGTTINLSNIASQAHNFEELNISNKSQNTTLSVKLSDVISLTDGDNTLKITADAGDKVEFKDAGWQKGASTDGYTTYTNDTAGTTVTVEIKDEVTQPM
nr:retention module-containing protein [uncultured Campylobacter sp.]